MPVTGQQFIDEPFLTTFWFTAAQLGASEATIGEVTGHSMMEVFRANRHNGQLLAFPYHDRRGSNALAKDGVQALWTRWQTEQAELQSKPQITLNHFRLTIDPYLEHDHG